MKKILILMTVVVIAFGIAGCGKKKGEGNKNEPETPVTSFETQVIDGVEISGMNMIYDEETGITQIVAIVKNTTEESMYLRLVDVYLKDKDGKDVAETFFFMDKELAPNTPEPFEANISRDVTNSKKAEFKITK